MEYFNIHQTVCAIINFIKHYYDEFTVDSIQLINFTKIA